MKTTQQNVQNHTSQCGFEQGGVSPPAQAKPSCWKVALTQLYAPSGELTQRRFLFLAGSVFFVSKIILIIILLIFVFFEDMGELRHAAFPIKIIAVTCELLLDVAIFHYPYINICNKRIKNMGIQSKYIILLVICIIILCELAAWVSDFLGINVITYAVVCFFLACKKSVKRKNNDTV